LVGVVIDLECFVLSIDVVRNMGDVRIEGFAWSIRIVTTIRRANQSAESACGLQVALQTDFILGDRA
jgi:hypothetical protein